MKQIKEYSEINSKILEATDIIAEPIKQTLSPKGGNVLYEDSNGEIFVTNDGVTIARNISVEDPIQDAVIRVIKHSALKTNNVAGDGTSTSILLSQALIKAGYKLIEEGWNRMDIKKAFEDFGEKLKKRLGKQVHKVSIDNNIELTNIATISANNDKEIAKDVVDIVQTIGDTGMVFLENGGAKTEIIKEKGFVVSNPLFAAEYANNGSAFSATYEDVHVFLIDKRIYYIEEVEYLINLCLNENIRNLVIIAQDFIGKAPESILINHKQLKNLNILPIKVKGDDNTNNTMVDLAAYLGLDIDKLKTDKIVGKVKKEDFIKVKKVYSDHRRSIIIPKQADNPVLEKRIKSIEKEYKKDKDNKDLAKRLATLTNGTVTVKIGGATAIEAKERMFRYEDAINATKVAVEDGYVAGGGVALYNSFNQKDYPIELVPIFKKYCESSIRQIAKNCGQHEDTILSNVKGNYGYNAKTGEMCDLVETGVIDPFKVTEMAINNSISVANVLITSRYFITNIKEKENE